MEDSLSSLHQKLNMWDQIDNKETRLSSLIQLILVSYEWNKQLVVTFSSRT